MLERGKGVAVWRQIEQQIADDIARGVFAEGSRLPTEPALAERFGVNRHTLRRAMRGLAERGLVRIEQGRGSFVQEDVIDYLIGARTRFSEIVSSQERRPGGRLLEAFEVGAQGAVAKALEVAAEAPCFRLETLHAADGRNIGIATNYFPAKRFPDMIPVFAERGSISAALAHYGVGDYRRRTTKVTARMPSRDDCRYLAHPANRPLLVSESVNVDSKGRAVQYAVTRFSGDRVQMVFETAG